MNFTKSMRSLAITFSLLFALVQISTAQHISDANFAAALKAGYPTAIDASNNLTAAAKTLTTLDVSGKNIADLTGIEGFTNLKTLLCDFNKLTSLPILPTGLTLINCNYNQLTILASLPSGLTVLDCSNNQLKSLPNLPGNLTELICASNQLTSLPSLPSSLQTLNCSVNQITGLTNLPISLQILYCNNNQLKSLPILPSGLQSLYCNDNQLTGLPSLPSGLKTLNCSVNQIPNLTNLSSSLQILFCNNNLITCLPTLPASLTTLTFDKSKIPCLPNNPNNVVPGYTICVPNTCCVKLTTPSITVQSDKTSYCAGEAIKFTAIATGAGSKAKYKWYKNGAVIGNQSGLTYSDNTLTSTDYIQASVTSDNTASADMCISITEVLSSKIFAVISVGTSIHIPDPNFAAALKANYPTTIDACNNLTPAAKTIGGMYLYYFDYSTYKNHGYNITDLTGVEGFTNLIFLDCNSNQLTSLPSLPSNLQYLTCASNKLTSLPSLPSSLTQLQFDNTKIPCITYTSTGLKLYDANSKSLGLGENYPKCSIVSTDAYFTTTCPTDFTVVSVSKYGTVVNWDEINMFKPIKGACDFIDTDNDPNDPNEEQQHNVPSVQRISGYYSGYPFEPNARILEKYTATDACGNKSSCSFFVTTTPVSSSIQQAVQSSGIITKTLSSDKACGYTVNGLYPNPVKDVLNLNITSVENNEVAFKIINSVGSVILTENKTLYNGENAVMFDVSQLQAGIYFIMHETTEGQNVPTKFIKL